MNSSKHSEKIIETIIVLKQRGHSFREIEALVGVPKSTVGDIWARYQKLEQIHPTSKYLFIDIENAPDLAVSFNRFKANLGQDNIIKEGGWLMSVSWRWMFEDKAQGIALSTKEAKASNDKRLIKTIAELIEEADVLIGHNIDGFDLPVIRSRMVINKLAPPKKVKTIDTLKIARQMRFRSNRLGSLGVALGEGDKASHSGISTWIGCMDGKQSSLDEMLIYNLEDVDLLYRVYMRLRGHDHTPVNAGLFTKKETEVCPCCGSSNVIATGNTSFTKISEFNEYECLDCGTRVRGRTAINTKAKRKALLV
jgi:transposase-like protein